MASTTAPQIPSNLCTPPRAAQMATRKLVSTNKDPNSSSVETLTYYYEDAAAGFSKSNNGLSTTASSAAAAVGGQEQQVWKISELKGQKQGEVVDAKAGGQGYSTTAGQK